MDVTARGPLTAALLARAIVGVFVGSLCLVILVSLVPGSGGIPVPGTPLDLTVGMVALAVAALEIWGLTRLAGRISELHRARTELTRAVVTEERLRFARQLNDLLGLRLSELLPRAELAYHLLPGNPQRARFELTEILAIARRAVSDIRAVADGYRDSEGSHGPRVDPENPAGTTLVSVVLAVAVLCGIVVQGVLSAARHAGGVLPFAVIVAALLLLLAAQLWYLPATRSRPVIGAGLLVAQAILVFTPAIVFGMPMVGAGFLAGTLLLTMAPVTGALAFAVVVVIAGGARAAASGLVRDVVQTAANVVISGLVVFAVTWMVRLVCELGMDRRRLARVAVAGERLRFARDLHDLLGLSLVAISLKSELGVKLVGCCPARARAQLTEILELSRLALVEVGLVAGGYRVLSLRQELRTAQALLAAVGVRVRVRVRCGRLPTAVGTLLATVLREGVSNVLQHSTGGHCQISMCRREDVVCLEIINDGVGRHPLGPLGPLGRRAGRGLDNLSYRAAQLGGTVSAGVGPDGWFRLRARVSALEPAGLLGDPDGVDPVAGVELADNRGQIVAHGPRR